MAIDRRVGIKWKPQGEALIPNTDVTDTGFGYVGADQQADYAAQLSYDSTLVSDTEALQKLLDLLDTEIPAQAPESQATIEATFNYEFF